MLTKGFFARDRQSVNNRKRGGTVNSGFPYRQGTGLVPRGQVQYGADSIWCDLRTGARLEAPSYQERLGLTMQYGMSAFLGTACVAIVGIGLIGRGTSTG